MDKIKVLILNEAHHDPLGMMYFLGRMTQKGHNVVDESSLLSLYNSCMEEKAKGVNMVQIWHGSIKRHTPITIAIVGASRRFLTQFRTHSIGIDWVSASLQYSDYSTTAQFCVPYELMERGEYAVDDYLQHCQNCLGVYKGMIDSGIDNDTAGYAMPQGLRNVLVATGNHEAWLNIIRVRACGRNTDETRFVATKIWELLRNVSNDGQQMFGYAGPDCLYGKCREGRMTCGKPLPVSGFTANEILKHDWPLIYKEDLA